MGGRGDPAHWASKDEAYWAGREEGFDRGYEEAMADKPPAPPAPVPVLAAPVDQPTAIAPARKKWVVWGVAAAAALVLWRMLRTWPGRLAVVGILIACAGIIQLGILVAGIVLLVLVASWALRTGTKAVADTRSGIAQLRAARDTAGRP